MKTMVAMVLSILLCPSPQVPCLYLLSKAHVRQLQFLFGLDVLGWGETSLSFTQEAAVDTLGRWGPYHYGTPLSIGY